MKVTIRLWVRVTDITIPKRSPAELQIANGHVFWHLAKVSSSLEKNRLQHLHLFRQPFFGIGLKRSRIESPGDPWYDFWLMFFVDSTGYKLLGDDTEMSKWILFPHQWEPSVGTYKFFELRIKGMIKHLAVQVWLVSDGFQKDICWGLFFQNTLPKTNDRWWQLKYFFVAPRKLGKMNPILTIIFF